MGTPEGWTSTTLGAVARWGSGGTPKVGDSRYYGGDIPWAVIGDLNDSIVRSTAQRITGLGLAESSAKLVPQGAVLVAMYGSIGKLGIAGVEMATNQAIAFAVPDSAVLDRDYLFHHLLAQRHELGRAGKGATQQNIGQGVLKAWPISFPEIGEQRRIVDLLEDHLSRLDAARRGLEAVRPRRLSLLLSAVSDEMFGSNSVAVRPLDELLEVSVGGVWGSPPGDEEVDVDVWRVTELRADGVLDPATAAVRSMTLPQLSRRRLRADDLLLEKSGGGPTKPVGRVGYVTTTPTAAVCSNFMHLLRPDPTLIQPRYLFWYLHAFHLRGGTHVMQKATTNIRNLKMPQYLSLPIPVPPVDVQEQAVARLERLLEADSTLAREVGKLQRRQEALRRSLLRAAFSGRLWSMADV